MNIVLCGLPKSGKTTIGKRLSHTLGWDFFDTDAVLEQQHGLSCRELFRREGEARFRQLENQLLHCLHHNHRYILSLGGGTLCHPGNIPLACALGTVVFLAASHEILWNRICNHGIPAYLDAQNPENEFHRLAAARIPLCESAAAYVIHTDGLTEDDVVKQFFNLGIVHGK